MAPTTFSPLATARTKKLNIYIMYEGNHPFIVGRRTEKNAKGKHVTREEFMKLGCLWPTRIAKTREEFATLLGETILDEVFAQPTPSAVNVPSGQQMFRGTAINAKARLSKAFKIDEDEVQEMPWEHEAREALERFMQTAKVDDEGKHQVELIDESDPHRMPFTCTDLGGLRSVLYEIGGNAWSHQVPVESGEQVFDWFEVSDRYIDRALELRHDIEQLLG